MAATSGATKKATASSITVWLQVDAQSGWPDLVAAANQQFQSEHPGTTVNVQYQNWGDHLQKFDATLAGGDGPDVIEMGNTEMTKYMAAGAFAEPRPQSTFDNSANWLKGLAASGMFDGKTYGVPVLRGLARRHLPDRPLQEGRDHEAAGDDWRSTWPTRRSCSRRTRRRASRPIYIAGTDWYVAMGFVFDYGGGIATQVSGKWKGLLASPKSIAGLTAYKNFFLATSRASKTTDETHPNPYDVYAQGQAASIIGPSWFSCCVGKKYTPTPAQFVMPSHVKGQTMPGFLGGSDLARPGDELEQGARGRLDQGLHEHELGEGPAGEGQHPERDQPARQQRERARGRPELVRPDGEALGRRRERQHPPQHAGADPHRQADDPAGGLVGQRQHRIGAEPAVTGDAKRSSMARRRRDRAPAVSAATPFLGPHGPGLGPVPADPAGRRRDRARSSATRSTASSGSRSRSTACSS